MRSSCEDGAKIVRRRREELGHTEDSLRHSHDACSIVLSPKLLHSGCTIACMCIYVWHFGCGCPEPQLDTLFGVRVIPPIRKRWEGKKHGNAMARPNLVESSSLERCVYVIVEMNPPATDEHGQDSDRLRSARCCHASASNVEPVCDDCFFRRSTDEPSPPACFPRLGGSRVKTISCVKPCPLQDGAGLRKGKGKKEGKKRSKVSVDRTRQPSWIEFEH